MSKPKNNPHLFLLNPSGKTKQFDASRGYKPKTINQKPAEAYSNQKNKLSSCLSKLSIDWEKRTENRSLDIPLHLEFIKIDFFVVFNDNDAFKNRAKFRKDFGLVPVLYTNFNQSVVFTIKDKLKFENFIHVLEQFISSPKEKHPSGTEYSILTIINSFEFLTSEIIVSTDFGTEIIISLINAPEEISEDFKGIYRLFIDYLDQQKAEQKIQTYYADENIIEVKAVSNETTKEIADNFDIIYKIHSIRVPTIRKNIYNQPDLTWGIEISPPEDNNVFIGILDNGVRPIDPLKNIIIDYGFDITRATPNPTLTGDPHGTVVASLAALGMKYFDKSEKKFIADGWIVPMKIIDFSQGYFNTSEIEEMIKKAYDKGVKLFNLSVTGPCKMYNSTISEYAYILDKLAYEYDLLIFIAAGNLSSDDVEEMKKNKSDIHDYPHHFYNPFKSSDFHTCECTNLCIPGESMNNLTIGAIADNCDDNSGSDLTPFKELPAFYTRKHFIDYTKMVNDTYFSDSQKNTNIRKPDIVMPGGDILNNDSGMHVMGFGTQGTDFFFYTAGTSLSAPLATNLAAKLKRLYPKISMQSIKAIILNSSQPLLKDEFLDFLVLGIKNDYAQNRYKKDYESLDALEKRQINTIIKSSDLYSKLVGNGMPIIDRVLYSTDKTVTFLVEDSIHTETHKAININIPEYLLLYSKSSYILELNATLCYKFNPVYNNQLAYNPLHISFNFINSIEKDNPDRVAEIISNRKEDFFEKFYEPDFDEKEKAKARKKALGIKAEIQSWSEDFYPRSNKPFSNVQNLNIKLSKDEIEKVDRQISLVVRATCKTDLEQSFLTVLQNTSHDFSIAITIKEKDNEELMNYDLYSELVNCNTLEQISKLNIEGQIDENIIIEAEL